MHHPIDKKHIVYNPFTDNFDIVREFNADRIITATQNAAGTKRLTYNAASATWIEDSPSIVVDNNGNMVVI